MVALVLVMGLPGSGKTTLCKKLEEALGSDVLRISFDELFSYCPVTGASTSCTALGYHGYEAYNTYAHTERKALESMIRNGLNTMKSEGKFSVPPYESILWNLSDSFIVVDDIFYLQSMRRPFERMARAHSLCYITILVDTPLEVALERNAGRPSAVFVPEETIRRIYNKMELPASENENFIRFGPNDGVEGLLTKITLFCSQKKITSRKQKATPRQIVTTDDDGLQRLEKRLRIYIGELVSEKKSQALARALGLAKREIVGEFRTRKFEEWKDLDLKAMLLSKATKELSTD